VTTPQTIAQRVEALPEAAQQEVLDFVEFLYSRAAAASTQEDETTWFDFSLTSAMRGMEDEASPYSAADLKESFG